MQWPYLLLPIAIILIVMAVLYFGRESETKIAVILDWQDPNTLAKVSELGKKNHILGTNLHLDEVHGVLTLHMIFTPKDAKNFYQQAKQLRDAEVVYL